MMTRRDCFAALALAVPAVAKTSNKIGLSRLSAITDEIATTPEGALAFAKLYNMQWLELRNVPGQGEYSRLDEAALKKAAQSFKEAAIRISFLNTGMLKFSLPGSELKTTRPENADQKKTRVERDQKRFEERMKWLSDAVRACHILDVKDVRVFSFLRANDPGQHYPRVAEIISEMAVVAEREGIRLLLENETSCNAATCEESAALLKLIPSKAVGLNWDVLNGFDMKEPAFPHGYSLLPKHRIWNVQAKGKSLLEEGKVQDWHGIIRALAKDGYSGCLGLENHMFGRMLFTNAHYAMRELIRVAETA